MGPVACAILLWGSLSWFLGAEWSLSEQYSYGWFVPLLAVALFALRWPDRPPARSPRWSGARAFLGNGLAISALLAIPFLRLVEVANPDWRPLGWLHALIVCGLTLFAIFLAGGRPWLRHFAFPVLFFLVAVPWTRGFEDFVIQQLMRGVARIAVDTVALLGVPALAEGNLIRIGGGVVGVNEACSGVRSLQTSLMLGLLLGEIYRFSTPRRFAVFAGAIGVALLANVFRTTYLVWLAAGRGLAEVERQHDVIGYLILGAVFLGSLALAALLKRGAVPPPAKTAAVLPASARVFPVWICVVVAGWLAASEIGVEGWFRGHERGLAEIPHWIVAWPEKAPGFRDLVIAETTARILRFDDGRAVIWKGTESGQPGERMVYYFRWKPGRNSAQLAADHRPDVCLPAAGLRQVEDFGRRSWPAATGVPEITFQHFQFVHRAGGREQPLHVFYCLVEDVPRTALGVNPYISSGGLDHVRKRIAVALAGRRNLGQQMLEVILPDVRSRSEAETEFGALLPTLIRPAPKS